MKTECRLKITRLVGVCVWGGSKKLHEASCCRLGVLSADSVSQLRVRNDDFCVPAKVLRAQPQGCGRDPPQENREVVQRGRRAAVTVSLGSARSRITWEHRGDRLFIKRLIFFFSSTTLR